MSDKLTILKIFVTTRWLRHFRSRRQVQRFQERMLRRHLAFVRRQSRYFAELPNITSLDQLADLPTMNKALMMEHFDDMNTVGLSKDRGLELAIRAERERDFDEMYHGIAVGLSSGTSGHRGLFVVSPTERSAWVGAVLAKLLPKGHLLNHRIAFFLRADNQLYETINSQLIAFKYFDIYGDMGQNLRDLEAYKPTILVAPPSVLGVISTGVGMTILQRSLQKIISVAEVLEPSDEARFQKAFGLAIIHQAYQCTEGFLGFSCEHGTLHLNEDAVIIEKSYLDEQRFVPIVTDFRRTSQPIIRYRLNDILVERSEPCPCGSALQPVERIEGREDDIFIFKDDDGRKVQIFADMVSRCLVYVPGIQEYRVTQVAHDAVTIYLNHVDKNVKRQVTAEFERLAGLKSFRMPTLSFAAFELDLSRKLKRVERLF